MKLHRDPQIMLSEAQFARTNFENAANLIAPPVLDRDAGRHVLQGAYAYGYRV